MKFKDIWSRMWKSASLPLIAIGIVAAVIIVLLMGGGSGNFSIGGIFTWFKKFWQGTSRSKAKDDEVASPKGDISVKEDVSADSSKGQGKVSDHLKDDEATGEKIQGHKGAFNDLTKDSSD